MKKDEGTTKILILEDDLETLAVLMSVLSKIESSEKNISIGVTVFSEYTQVEDYVNKIIKPNFDIIILDRDCHIGGSFHVLDFNRFNTNKIISISTVPQWNNEAAARGVKNICWKNHDNIEDWGDRIFEVIKRFFKCD